MRTIWKGSISFGLVSIPIKLYGATESHSVSFRQIHTADGGQIRYRKVCSVEDAEVPSEEIGKGFQAPDGTLVPLTDTDLASLPLPTAKTLEILAFVPADSIDPLQIDRSYYVGTDGGAADKPYVLLREALEQRGMTAVAKVALRGRETLAMLRSLNDVLVMHTLLWPDEIRSSACLAPDTNVTVRDAELDLAQTLMDTLSELDWDALHDTYREAVEELVTAKLEGTTVSGEAPEPDSGKVVDLMAALEKSVRAAGARDGDGGGEAGSGAAETSEATVTPIKATAKKTSAKKTAAKTATKKTAKKTASSTAKKTAKTAKTAKKTASSRKTATSQKSGQQGTKKAASSGTEAQKSTRKRRSSA